MKRELEAAARAAARALRKAAERAARVVAKAAVVVAKAAYKYSGAQSVVSCVTNPTLSSCVQAAVTVAAVVATGGEAEVEVAAVDAAEDAGTQAAEDVGETAAEDGGGTTLYRGMTPDGEGPMVGPSARMLGARPNVDIPVGDGGNVNPGDGGMSVNESPTGMPEYRRPPSFGGSGKNLEMYGMESGDLPDGLSYRPDPDQPGHGFIEPSYPMRFDDYQDLLGGTVGSWGVVNP